ncbi:MAG: 3'-5' exonuclease [Rikenellaceae bacterium]
MALKLNRPLVFFDLETTGLDVVNDRIVEISLLKVLPDGSQEIKTRRLNPTIPISAESTAVHGITDDMVKDEPTFAQVARSLYRWIEGADLAGFNSNRFDVPMLVEELERAGVSVDTSSIKLVDVQNIFHKREPRTLVAAYKFYCGEELENAHSAEADITATYEVLLAQIEKYEDLGNTVDELSLVSTMNRNVDLAGRVVLDDNDVPVFNFGKYKGCSVAQTFQRDPSYYTWIMDRDFLQNTKNVVTRLRLEMLKK